MYSLYFNREPRKEKISILKYHFIKTDILKYFFLCFSCFLLVSIALYKIIYAYKYLKTAKILKSNKESLGKIIIEFRVRVQIFLTSPMFGLLLQF